MELFKTRTPNKNITMIIFIKWMQEQERDPEAMVNMLRKIHNTNRYRHGNIPPYLLTHPGPDTRMSYIQDLILFSEKKPYVKVAEFAFQRFKRRILSLTKDPIQIINHYQFIRF